MTYNLKILTSALFSVTMLGQKLSKRKWLSLIALFVGVTVVQSDNHKSDSDAPHPETGLGYQTFGFLAVVAAAFTSDSAASTSRRSCRREKRTCGSATRRWA